MLDTERPEAIELATLLRELGGDPHPDLNGIVVARDAKLIAEAYFNGANRDTLHDIRSAAKSVTSTLVGIAIDRGLIESVEAPIGQYLPGVEAERRRIRIRDLLNMRSGLAANDSAPDSPGNEDRLDESHDWLRFALSLPVEHPPGSVYAYASVNAFLAGAVVEHASGMRLDEFAARYLFDPLGIGRFKWRHGPQNCGAGQGNLQISARDAMKIGQLMLDNGRYRGAQVVSEKWVRDSLAPQVSISAVDPYADWYGFMWYTKLLSVDGRPVNIHFASGNGGNKIYIIPASRMVVVITSSAYDTNYGQKRSQSILLRILALAGRHAGPRSDRPF
jgi:CubicO group peptidase (beta-lactamase class C family)